MKQRKRNTKKLIFWRTCIKAPRYNTFITKSEQVYIINVEAVTLRQI